MSVFELEKAEIWINEVKAALGIKDEDAAYLALRAGLHALRDRLTVEEAVHLSAQLPMMIRGLYFEGWHPGKKRSGQRSRESFLQAIEREMPRSELDAGSVARAVFRVLDKHVSHGQLENVRHSLPHRVGELWQAPVPLP